jgi:hypothetical protein
MVTFWAIFDRLSSKKWQISLKAMLGVFSG